MSDKVKVAVLGYILTMIGLLGFCLHQPSDPGTAKLWGLSAGMLIATGLGFMGVAYLGGSDNA